MTRKPGFLPGEKHGTATREARFWRRVDKSGGPDACWPWRGVIGTPGYGMYQWHPRGTGRSPEGAHRIAYRLIKGRIPKGHHIMHACNNKRCCNPAHLSPGTVAMNAAAAARDGLYCRGEGAVHARLTAAQVEEIRAADLSWYGAKVQACAKFNISRATLHRVLARTIWKHL